MKAQEYRTFRDFYPFYLSEHQNRICRRLHFIGSTIVLCMLAEALITQMWWHLALMPVAGYLFAWIGHFAFEKNRPATFTYPFYSFMGDWVMYVDIIRGRLPF